MGKVIKAGATAIHPCPVVLVTCVDGHSAPNIITLAWAGVACSEPPMVGISIRPHRYSHGLIVKSGEFVVNVPTEDILLQTDYCGSVSGKDVDKFAKTGLTPISASQVKPPLIKECPVNLECLVSQVISLGAHDLILGQVLATHIDEELLDASGEIRSIKGAKPIAFSPLTSEYLSMGSIIGSYGYSQEQGL
ncbi:MAG TPA: flavin reductase family protein [Armatimonadota bacterium]|nr:flavin reductase family protein [Armatimonadota bacterium]